MYGGRKLKKLDLGCSDIKDEDKAVKRALTSKHCKLIENFSSFFVVVVVLLLLLPLNIDLEICFVLT